ncbi:hypothetical protein JVT61DRAFT_3261 [Boletus reticuloceps]|uniref:Uncharacterized protein n=1 Tax=Boletus reticuloceps TaxID=495285 RepID=A0A8I2YRI8_9AGAM|nr:hypothetical protein JVT61DRAFT_3261 [Boletus reticuloceps]
MAVTLYGQTSSAIFYFTSTQSSKRCFSDHCTEWSLETWFRDRLARLPCNNVCAWGVEIKTKILIHPWISSLLDQEFSHSSRALDDTTRALQLVVRLRQPFGALLLKPVSQRIV